MRGEFHGALRYPDRATPFFEQAVDSPQFEVWAHRLVPCSLQLVLLDSVGPDIVGAENTPDLAVIGI